MRLVVQRVMRAAVRVGDELLAEIGPGALVLAGIGLSDSGEVVDRMADKLVGLRYFEDDDGRTNRSIGDADGELLVVSQFTLYADVAVGTGRFGADMAVELVNDGPFTLMLDSERDLA